MILSIELAKDFDEVESFVCGVDALDFGKSLWRDYSIHYFAVFYFVRNSENGDIVAVFALQNDLLNLDSDDKSDMKSGFIPAPEIKTENFWEEFNNRSYFPAVELSLLVISKGYQRIGIGKTLVNAIFKMLKQEPSSGCMFVTVEALAGKKYSTLGFYSKLGFTNCFPVPRNGIMRMFAPLYPKVA